MLVVASGVLAGFGVAQAAPRFVATAVDDAALASSAWEAGVACTGREGAATDDVAIVRRTIPGGWLGVAHTDPQGRLHRIDVGTDGDRSSEVIVHEVSHAWISDGPVALVEGTAELLADCIASRLHGAAPLQWDDGRDLSGLPDLVVWAPAGEHEPSELGVIRTDAYLGAGRLLRAAALVVPPTELWADSSLHWSELRDALARGGEKGAMLLEALDAGGAGQRVALADADHDGLSAVVEEWMGTSDNVFDSDRDGWWDGAQAPPGGLAVPLDGTPICTGFAAGDGGAGVTVGWGGSLRGEGVPSVVARPASRPRGWSGSTGAWGRTPRLSFVPAGDSLLVQLDAPAGPTTAGAVWATVEGTGLTADAGCRSTRTTTVWAADPTLAPVVAQLAPLLADVGRDADHRLGAATGRLAVALGGTTTAIDGNLVWISTMEVQAAVEHSALGDLARLAVAARRLDLAGDRDWRSAQALALSLRK